MSFDCTNLKRGDKALYMPRHGHKAVHSVARVTETQIVLKFKNHIGSIYEVKFYKASGRKVGGDRFVTDWIRPATDADEDQLKQESQRQRVLLDVKTTKFTELTTERLERIWAIISE